MNVKLLRTSTGSQGTFGVLITRHYECYTLELPWHDNRNSISCIPVGVYDAQFIISSKYGPAYWIRKVPDRSEILIHSGNFAGDRSEGWETHSLGCIMLGESKGVLGSQKAILLSRKALRQFIDREMERDDFKLEVKEMY